MHNSYNQIYSTVFCLLYMFRTNLVIHHHEHGIIYCITQFDTIMQESLSALKFNAAKLSCTILPIELCNTVYYTVLMMVNE